MLTGIAGTLHFEQEEGLRRMVDARLRAYHAGLLIIKRLSWHKRYHFVLSGQFACSVSGIQMVSHFQVPDAYVADCKSIQYTRIYPAWHPPNPCRPCDVCFRLYRAEKGFSAGIVPTVTFPTHTPNHAVLFQLVDIGFAAVLASLI